MLFQLGFYYLFYRYVCHHHYYYPGHYVVEYYLCLVTCNVDNGMCAPFSILTCIVTRTPPQARANKCFDIWHRAFHGTTVDTVPGIMRVGYLLLPGDRIQRHIKKGLSVVCLSE